MTTMMMLFWDLNTADDDDDCGGDDDDDDDNDNGDNYDDDDHAFLGFTHLTCSNRSLVNGQNFDRRFLTKQGTTLPFCRHSPTHSLSQSEIRFPA